MAVYHGGIHPARREMEMERPARDLLGLGAGRCSRKPTSIHDATQSRGVAGISGERPPSLHTVVGPVQDGSDSLACSRFSHDFEIWLLRSLLPVSSSSFPILSHLPSPTDSQSVFSFRINPPSPSPTSFPIISLLLSRLRNLSEDPDPSLPCNIASPQHLPRLC